MGTWGSIYNNTIYGAKYQAKMLTKLQEQVATGSRIIRASDGPSNAHRIMSLRDASKSMENYNHNLTEVELSLNEASNVVTKLSDLFRRVDVLVTQSANGTYMSDNREAIGEEIDTILEQAVSLSNHKVLGRYIFGGADSFEKPYEVTREQGRITKVEYVGSYKEQPVPVGPDVTMSGQMVGERIFRNNSRQDPEFYGNTGAVAGVGTSSLRGDNWLTLTHTTTTFDPASAVVSGTSGDSSDTVLGKNHTITLDATGGAGTIRLDNGQTVSFAGGETNIKLTNEFGDICYVDVSGVNNETGAFSLTANGEAKLENGSAVTLDYNEANLSIETDDERLLYVDCNNIARTGVESVSVPGTYDVFGALISIRDILLNERDMSTEEQFDALSRASDNIGEINSGFRQRMTIIGGRLGGVESLRNTLESMKFNTDAEADAIQQADIVDVATELARVETLYQMSLNVAANVISMSLLDYI